MIRETGPGRAPEVETSGATAWVMLSAMKLADFLGPVLGHHVLRGGLLCLGREHQICARRWRQSRLSGLVDSSVRDERRQFDRARETLEPQVLAGDGVQV